jgi:hypothetical protein
MQICPDAELRIKEADRSFRLGLLVRDADGGIWGLTARHTFPNHAVEITLASGEAFTVFDPAQNEPWTPDSDITYQIVRFVVPIGLLNPANLKSSVVWPRDAMEPSRLLGARVVSLASQERIIGTIVETNGLARVRFAADKDASPITGGAILSLDDERLLRPGMAGSLVISEACEAIGLAIARQRTEIGVEIVVSPVAPYLERNKLTLWAPPGAHWSDLRQRVTMFERAATRSLPAYLEDDDRPPSRSLR